MRLIREYDTGEGRFAMIWLHDDGRWIVDFVADALWDSRVYPTREAAEAASRAFVEDEEG